MPKKNIVTEIEGLKIKKFEDLSTPCQKDGEKIGDINWESCKCFRLKPRIKIPGDKRKVFRFRGTEFYEKRCKNAYPIILNGEKIIGIACTYKDSQK